MTPSISTSMHHFSPMPRPTSTNAPCFDGRNLTDFLTILLRYGEYAALSPDQLTPLIVAYCTPEVQRVIRHIPELQRDAKSWQDAVRELRALYSSEDTIATYTITDLQALCRETCRGLPFRSLSDAETYLCHFTQISGYLHELGLLAADEVQVYLVAGLPFATRKDVEARLPDSNRGTDSPPTKRQVMDILRDLLRRDSFETFVATRLLPTPSHLSISSSAAPVSSVPQPRVESKPKPRSNRCFVCGGTRTHRLGPRFCPRTWELVEDGLARFDAVGRLVSHDGSPLPMTRNSGGVAAHLFDLLYRPHPRSIPQHPSPLVDQHRDMPIRDTPSNRNPPQPPIAVRKPPLPMFQPTTITSIPSNELRLPKSGSNPPQFPTPSRVPSTHIPIVRPDSRFNSNPPQPSHVHSPVNIPVPPLSTTFDTAIPTGVSDQTGFIDIDPKQLLQPVTLKFGDLLALSPALRHKFAEHLKSFDPPSVVLSPAPALPTSHSPVSSILKLLRTTISPSSILILVVASFFAGPIFTPSSKHRGYYGYFLDVGDDIKIPRTVVEP
ncbi:hypothetical protein C8R43DRAFT_1207644 [Mycena crocata]|nr:hypothetical protein C8R43DRAFT_1207644 [Mycena crocata]